MSPELQQYKADALSELVALKTVLVGVIEKLEGGCPITVAYELVDNLWLPSEATRIKTELSSEFPEQNGRVILNSPLSGEVSLLMSIPKTLEFMDKAFPEIISKVNEIYTAINNLGLTDQEAIDKYNLFRQQPARFADFVRDLWYPDSERLENGQVSSWGDLNKETSSVENGDYLLLVDYGEAIRKSQQSLKECLIDSLVTDDMRLGYGRYKIEQLIGMVSLIGLFGTYLDNFEV